MTEPKKPKLSEAELRRMLSRKAKLFLKAIVTKRCRQLLLEHAQLYHSVYLRAEALAELKRKRRPQYRQVSEQFLSQFIGADIGHLNELPPDTLLGLEKLFDSLLAVISGKPPEQFTGLEFVTLTKRLFVPPKIPGPRPLSKYNEAFARRMKNERLSTIIKDLEPEAYAHNRYATTQRYSAAISTRKKKTARI